MPTPVTLSPLEHPYIYAEFVLNIGAALFSAWVCVYFHQLTRQGFWLLAAVAFALMTLPDLVVPLTYHLWPLPFDIDFPEVVMPGGPTAPGMLSAKTIYKEHLQFINPAFTHYLLALALGVGYVKSRRDPKFRPS